jgi:signal transduction histidine kinase
MMRRFRTVRFRATLAATFVVALALAAAGVALTQVLREAQLQTIDTTLELRSQDVESLVVSGGDFSTIRIEEFDDSFVQVIDRTGAVVKASENIVGEPPLIDVSGDRERWLTTQLPAVARESLRVHVHRTGGPRPLTVIVGANLEYVDDVLGAVRRALLVGLPVLLVTIASMIWLVIGRALRPVEAIRSGVAEIGGGDLDRRVPEPETDDEIGRLARTMNDMLRRLEAADIAQARFVSNASHELRTPIAIIRHELEDALRRDDDALLRQAAEDSLEEDIRMQRLVDDLLFLARHDAASGATQQISRVLVDLDDIALAEAHRVHTSKHVDTSRVSAGQVRGDPDQLGRVLRNLIDNALRHATTTVAITVASANGTVVVHVDDDGNGVVEADRVRIFERFERADEARARNDGGSGLGLAIVTEIVADHAAAVAVGTSPELGGARFTLTFTDARS